MWLFGRSVHPCTRLAARRNEAPPSAALAPSQISGPCTVAPKADTAVGLRSMHTRTTTSPAPARGRSRNGRSRRTGRAAAVAVAHNSAAGSPRRVAASPSLSTEQRRTAKPCAATQPFPPYSHWPPRPWIMPPLPGDTVPPSLLPFTRAMYVRTPTYLWWDDEGRVHDIAPAEGSRTGTLRAWPARLASRG